MPRMIFDLTDDDRALLEAHRVRVGSRSHAETLRVLIRSAETGSVDVVPVGLREPAQVRVSEDAIVAPVAGHVVAPSGAGRKMVDAGVKRDSYPGWMKGKK